MKFGFRDHSVIGDVILLGSGIGIRGGAVTRRVLTSLIMKEGQSGRRGLVQQLHIGELYLPQWPHRRRLLNQLPVRHETWGY